MIDESERSAETESASESADLQGPAQDAHRAISSMILAGMRGGPTWTKVLLAMFGVAAIVAIVISSLLMAGDEPNLAFWVFVIASVFSMLALLVLLRIAITDGPPLPTGSMLWSSGMPRQPLQPSNIVKELGRRIEDLRNDTVVWLQENVDQSVAPKQVRAHVFMVDYEAAVQAGVGELFMPDSLRIGMKGHPDEHIRFWAGEGVAGATYSKQLTQQTQVTWMEKGEFTFAGAPVFRGKHGRMIHPDLRWIVTFPLIVALPDQEQETLGVLGIHGLGFDLPDEKLEMLRGHLSSRVLLVAAGVAKLRRVRLTVIVEEAAVTIASSGNIVVGNVSESAEGKAAQDLSRFAGVIKLTEDPLIFQHRMRGEWE